MVISHMMLTGRASTLLMILSACNQFLPVQVQDTHDDYCFGSCLLLSPLSVNMASLTPSFLSSSLAFLICSSSCRATCSQA